MIEQTRAHPAPDEAVAITISADEYLERYAADHYEWVKGVVVKMSPVSKRHALLVDYLKDFFRAYFTLNPIGAVFGEPFIMRLDAVEVIREPDLQIILHTNPGQLTETGMIGPADICVEVVSSESVARDYGKKFEEYEKAGVGEYWIIDPLRQECRFHRLGDSGLYTTIQPDEQNYYSTPRLPKLMLHVSTLWQDPLPDFFAIGQAVQTMLK
jgi:Uma2 family endonuclease